MKILNRKKIVIALGSIVGIFSVPVVAFADIGDKILANIILPIIGIFVSISLFLLAKANSLLVSSIEFSMGEPWRQVSEASASAGGEVFLGIANIALIFILLFIGIATILQIQTYGYKQLLSNLIIIALLVNFSFLIAQTIIGVANSMAIEIVGGENNIASIGTQFKDASLLSTLAFYDAVTGNLAKTGAAILAVIFILLVAFIFAAAAILLMIRMAVLAFLIMLAPLAFVAWLLPMTSQYSTQWWQKLLSQSFFAPLYFLLVISSFKVLAAVPRPSGTFASSSEASTASPLEALTYFILANALLLGSLMIAKRLGAYGAGAAIRFGHRLRRGSQGFLLRNSAGRLSYMLANSGLMKGLESRSHQIPIIGGALGDLASSARRGLQSTAGLRFGSQQSFVDVTRRKEEQARETFEHVGKTGNLIRKSGESLDDFNKRVRARRKYAQERQDAFVEGKRQAAYGLGSTQARAAAAAVQESSTKRSQKAELDKALAGTENELARLLVQAFGDVAERGQLDADGNVQKNAQGQIVDRDGNVIEKSPTQSMDPNERRLLKNIQEAIIKGDDELQRVIAEEVGAGNFESLLSVIRSLDRQEAARIEVQLREGASGETAVGLIDRKYALEERGEEVRGLSERRVRYESDARAQRTAGEVGSTVQKALEQGGASPETARQAAQAVEGASKKEE